jgi:phosphatidylglycerophosphate synthase
MSRANRIAAGARHSDVLGGDDVGMTTQAEERARLNAAVKANDGFFATFFVSPYSKYLARSAARHGWTPNAVTLVSFAIGLAAAACFGTGTRWASVAGALLLQASFTADCVDGQLARYTRTFSSLGAWLDSVLDRTKEHLVYAGLAIGATRGYDEDVWLLACCALALLTVRHLGDAAYVAGRGGRPEAEPARTGARVWLARVFAFPIGERFLAISVTAAVLTPRITFTVLLAWGGLATSYALARRALVGGTQRGDYSAYRDDGPLGARLLTGARLSWLSAPLIRVVEFGAVIAIVALADSTELPTCFAFLAVLAFHQYDTILRLEQGRAPLASAGWEGHVFFVGIAALFGALGLFFVVVTLILGVYFVAGAAVSWLRIERKRVHMEDAG